jgi:hypothetical protein
MNKNFLNNNFKNFYLGTNHLERLSTYLNYEFSYWGLCSLSFLAGAIVFLFSVLKLSFITYILMCLPLLAILLFTLYMLFVLMKEKRYGWIIFLFCIVLLPLILILLFIPDPFFIPITLAPFFLYCFMLKTAVNDWIRERNFLLRSLD